MVKRERQDGREKRDGGTWAEEHPVPPILYEKEKTFTTEKKRLTV